VPGLPDRVRCVLPVAARPDEESFGPGSQLALLRAPGEPGVDRVELLGYLDGGFVAVSRPGSQLT